MTDETTHENSITGPRPAPEGAAGEAGASFHVKRKSHDIFGGENKGEGSTQSLLFTLLKKAAKLASDPETREDAETNAGISVGTKSHLMDKLTARELRDFNDTHAICIDAKVSSSTGLGHRDLEVHETLDPLTRFSWQDTLNALSNDYWETGECFLECVYGDEDEPRKITGLHHLESAQVEVEVEEENNAELYHYVVQGETGGAETIVMAKFGDLEDLKKRFGIEGSSSIRDRMGTSESQGQGSVDTREVQISQMNANDAPRTNRGAGVSGTIVDSEIIHIRQSTNRSRYYGYPDYMSAVPSIELVQCMAQHEFDFYFNRGVPEFILFLLGKNIGKCWDKIETLIKANQGPGNSHKTGGVHIPGSPDEVAVQVEKLAMDESSDGKGFAEKAHTLDMRIATAHGMPPQLANIFLPGKIGASNETPNAMLLFQMRKLGQAQKNFSRALACSLGSDDVTLAQPTGSPASLTADQFLGKDAQPMNEETGMPQFVQPGNGFNTILDGMTLGAQQTMARMEDPMGATDRNPEDGLLDGARDRQPGDRRATRSMGRAAQAEAGRNAPQAGNAEIGRNAPQNGRG